MEISNKTLGIFLVAAVVISIGGTILSLERLNSITTVGRATSDLGIANLTITSAASILFAIDAIDFGTGSVNTTGNNQQCNLTINASSAITQAGCSGFNANNPYGDTFIIENDGNKFINVTLNSTVNATEFLGGDWDLAVFQYAISNNESDSCVGTISGGDWVSFNKIDTNICSNMSFSDTEDSLRIGIRMSIPYNSLTGLRTATLVATGEEFV